MKKNLLPVFIILSGMLFSSCRHMPVRLLDAISGATKTMTPDGNSLYHQTEAVSLVAGSLEITGEVKKPGMVNLDNHYKREVFLKESVYDPDSGLVFRGAYRYRGYSLFDLLHSFTQQKKNAESFRPPTDLYIIIENDLGEAVSFSWSEIFHSIHAHQVLIATEAAPIYPYRRQLEYPLGGSWKVVAASDLFAFRSLENPVRITVRSFDHKEYPIDRDHQPVPSPWISVAVHGEPSWRVNLTETQHTTYQSTFYGMGMGYHPADTFTGPGIDHILPSSTPAFNAGWNRTGLICMAGADGYRAVYSFSELFNRADQVLPILAMPADPEKSGSYRMFLPTDFYADRSVKQLEEVYFFKPM